MKNISDCDTLELKVHMNIKNYVQLFGIWKKNNWKFYVLTNEKNFAIVPQRFTQSNQENEKWNDIHNDMISNLELNENSWVLKNWDKSLRDLLINWQNRGRWDEEFWKFGTISIL